MSQSLKEFINSNSLEVMSVVGSDMHGIARGKKVPVRRLIESESAPIRISNLMHMMDYASMPFPPPDDGRWWPSWAEGYTDTRAVLDVSTARVVPWQRDTGLVLCDFERVDGAGPVAYLPRNMLKTVLGALDDHGFSTRCAVELEFMLFDETESSCVEKHFQDLTPLWSLPEAYSLTKLGKFEDIIRQFRDDLEGFGLPIETWNVEAGPGQVEMNMPPSDALTAADRGFLFKHAVKEVAATMDLTASFIPKLSLLGFGNGSHLNFSLWRDGANVFHDDSDVDRRSKLLRQFCSGIASTLREFTLLYAPTINSYRRFVPYYSTGMTASWGYDNKSVTVRTVNESASLTRLEQRTAGADVNPYIQVAACVAAGLHGIENELDVAPTLGDAYADTTLDPVPATIVEALDLFEQSEVANSYLGEDFVRFHTQASRVEAEAFAASLEESGGQCGGGDDAEDGSEVTAWELARYFTVV